MIIYSTRNQNENQNEKQIEKQIDYDFIDSFYEKYKGIYGYIKGEKALEVAKKMGINMNGAIQKRKDFGGVLELRIHVVNKTPFFSYKENEKGVSINTSQYFFKSNNKEIDYKLFDEYFFDNWEKYADLINIHFRKKVKEKKERERKRDEIRILREKEDKERREKEKKKYGKSINDDFYYCISDNKDYGDEFDYPILSVCDGKTLKEAIEKSTNFYGSIPFGTNEELNFEVGEAFEILTKKSKRISSSKVSFLEGLNIPSIDLVQELLEKE